MLPDILSQVQPMRAAQMAEGLLVSPNGPNLTVGFDNYNDAEFTVITMEGKDRSAQCLRPTLDCRCQCCLATC